MRAAYFSLVFGDTMSYLCSCAFECILRACVCDLAVSQVAKLKAAAAAALAAAVEAADRGLDGSEGLQLKLPPVRASMTADDFKV